jgi:hypothetical protein
MVIGVYSVGVVKSLMGLGSKEASAHKNKHEFPVDGWQVNGERTGGDVV